MKRVLAIIAMVTAITAISSCEKYDDGRPSKDVRAEFNRMYPDAWDVEWDLEPGLNGTCWEVSFETGKRPDGTEHEAWFDMDGNWLKTKTELFMVAVPQNIKDFLKASEYGNKTLEDHTVDFYETPTGNFYRFDIYLNGVEVAIDVTDKGDVSLVGNIKI